MYSILLLTSLFPLPEIFLSQLPIHFAHIPVKAGRNVPGAKRNYMEAGESGRDQTLKDLDDQVKLLRFCAVSSRMLYKGSNVLFEF